MGPPVKVTAAIIEKNGRYLIAKRNKDAHIEECWEFPGGKIEENETPEECLIREIKEELNIDIMVLDKYHTNIHRYDKMTIKLLSYRAEYVSGELQLNDHSEIRWIDKSEFMAFDFAPADLPIIKKLCNPF